MQRLPQSTNILCLSKYGSGLKITIKILQAVVCTVYVYLSGIFTDMYAVQLNSKTTVVNYAVGQAGMSVHLPPYKVCICSIYKLPITLVNKI